MQYCQQRNPGRLTGWDAGPLPSPAEKSYKPSLGRRRREAHWYGILEAKGPGPGERVGAMGVPVDARGRDPSSPNLETSPTCCA